MTSVPPRRSWSDYDVSTGNDNGWSLTDRLLSGARRVGRAAQATGRVAREVDRAVLRSTSETAQAVGRGALSGARSVYQLNRDMATGTSAAIKRLAQLEAEGAVYTAKAIGSGASAAARGVASAARSVDDFLGGQYTDTPATAKPAKAFGSAVPKVPLGPAFPTVSSGSGKASVDGITERDRQDRQGRFPSPSPDRLRERGTPMTRQTGRSGRQDYNEMTYSQPDVSMLGEAKSGWPTPAPARAVAKDPAWRGGPWTEQSNVPLRQQAAGGPSPSSAAGKSRRIQSTESAFRAADTSMFDAPEPKAAPLKDYKSRGKIIEHSNLKAFY